MIIKKVRWLHCLCGGTLLLLAAQAQAQAELNVRQAGKVFELTNDTQRVTLKPMADGHLTLTTDVWIDGKWRALFDGDRPLVGGENFDLIPTHVEIAEDAPGRKALRLSGRQAKQDYAWQARVEATSGSQLIHFAINCDLQKPLHLTQPQPTVALWMQNSSPTLTLDQGPPSPTGDAYNVPFNFGFPAAYLWDDGREAAIFFNMTPATWFSREGVYRYLDVQIKTSSQADQTGLGMIPRRHWGDTIAAGPMNIDFYLHAAARAAKPSKFEALDTMLLAFQPLHPATAPFPKNTLTGGAVSWTSFTLNSVRDLMLEDVTMTRIPTPWPEAPVDLGLFIKETLIHNSFIQSDPEVRQKGWQFSTSNHALGGWMLFARMHPEANALEVARTKKDTIGRYQDRVTGMITSGIREPNNDNTEGLLEISWQSLVFYQAVWQIDQTTSYEDFNPSLLGRLLMAADAMIEYAHNVDYVFSTYFDPYHKQPVVFSENNDLGAVREPWSVGSYAYVMMRYYQITGEERFKTEAEHAMDVLLHTMRYTVSNKYINATYADPMDMPVMELMGNGYGAVAAYKMFQADGNPAMQRTARDFLNTLVRMTYWFEDQTEPVSRSMNTVGLFYPFVGASCATPWETQEANFAMAWMLREDKTNPLNPLLLKLSNLNRINGFNFYPATYADVTRAVNPNLRRDIGQYSPIEELYGLEAPGGSKGGHGTATYMSSHAFWNWWLYEALAESSDRAVMVLNPDALDHLEEAISGARRSLIVYNPEGDARAISLILKQLPAGQYDIELADAQGRTISSAKHTAEELMHGMPLKLDAGESLRVTLKQQDTKPIEQIEAARDTRFLLARAYQAVQNAGLDTTATTQLDKLKTGFSEALAAYRAHDLPAADRHAREVLDVRTR